MIRYRSAITDKVPTKKIYISYNSQMLETPLSWWYQLYGEGSCVIFFTQRDVSVFQNMYTTATTTICTGYVYMTKQARAFRFAITLASMKYMGD